MTILITCGDQERMDRLKDAVHSAGFTTANGVDEGWSKTDCFDFSAVVIEPFAYERHRRLFPWPALYHFAHGRGDASRGGKRWS